MSLNLKSQSGQSLTEVLAALAVVILVILALTVVSTISIRNATFARNQSLATKYAQKAIEEARDLRNRNKDDFFNGSVVCNKTEDISPFHIERTCNPAGSDKMEIKVTVSWTGVKGNHQSELTTYLTKW